jgi:hypothetical protein
VEVTRSAPTKFLTPLCQPGARQVEYLIRRVHRAHRAEVLDAAYAAHFERFDALLFGRVTYEMIGGSVAAADADGGEA